MLIDDYNQNQKWKLLIAFDELIMDIKTNEKFQAVVKELLGLEN